MTGIVIFTLVVCGLFIGGTIFAWKRNEEGALGCVTMGIVIMIFLIILGTKIIPNGMPLTSLGAGDYPGIRYEVIKVVGEFDKVEVVILDKEGQREYHTIRREIVVNKEIPLDTKELTAIQTVKGPRIVMGPFETFDLNSK